MSLHTPTARWIALTVGFLLLATVVPQLASLVLLAAPVVWWLSRRGRVYVDPTPQVVRAKEWAVLYESGYYTFRGRRVREHPLPVVERFDELLNERQVLRRLRQLHPYDPVKGLAPVQGGEPGVDYEMGHKVGRR